MSEKGLSFKIKLGSTNQFFSETKIESHGLKKKEMTLTVTKILGGWKVWKWCDVTNII